MPTHQNAKSRRQLIVVRFGTKCGKTGRVSMKQLGTKHMTACWRTLVTHESQSLLNANHDEVQRAAASTRNRPPRRRHRYLQIAAIDLEPPGIR